MLYMKTLIIALITLLIPCAAQVWEAPATGFLTTSPQVATSSVIQATSSGQLTAFSQATGAPVWSRQLTGAALNRPTLLIANDLIVTSSPDGAVYACQLATGIPTWTFSNGAPIFSHLSADATQIYGGTANGDLFALNQQGEQVWRVNLDQPLLGTPTVAGDSLFVYANGAALHARSIGDGGSLWSTPVIYLGAASTPLVVGSRVYMPGGGTTVTAFTAATGIVEWSTPLPAIASTPLTSGDGRIYVGSADGTVSALDEASGALIWQTSLGGFLSAAPTVSGNTLLIGIPAGQLVILNSATGATLQSIDVNGPVVAAPTQVGATTLVPLGQGQLVSLGLTT